MRERGRRKLRNRNKKKSRIDTEDLKKNPRNRKLGKRELKSNPASIDVTLKELIKVAKQDPNQGRCLDHSTPPNLQSSAVSHSTPLDFGNRTIHISKKNIGG